MSRWTEFVDRYYAFRTLSPDDRLNLGLPDGLGDCPDPTLQAEDDMAAEAEALLAIAQDLSPDELTPDERLDRQLAIWALKDRLHAHHRRFNDRSRHEQLPEAGASIGNSLFMLFVLDPRAAHDRLHDIVARLEQVPAYLAAYRTRITVPVARWRDIEVQRVEGLPSLLTNIREWAELQDFEDLMRLSAAIEAAEEAMADYATWLGELPTSTNLHLGLEAAQTIVANRGIELSLDELHAIARDFLARNRADLLALREVLVPKYGLPDDTTVEQLHAFLNDRYKVSIREGHLEDVLTRYEQEREKILSFIEQRDLFPILPDQDMKILRTPTFLEPSIPAGAMSAPPPLREGTRTSIIYLTLSEELLDEHTELGIPGMMIHEGIPGHHLQLATASTHPSVIRRMTDGANDMFEGWTTMLEDYMLDQGYMGELTDEARFSGRRDIARIGARVAIDLFFMTGERRFLDVGLDVDVSHEDPFEAAGALLKAVTGFTDGRVQAELNWYSVERGYPLSYLTGNHLVWKLKEDVAAHWQGDVLERDRAFHRTFLTNGNMPVSMMREVMRREGLLPQA